MEGEITINICINDLPTTIKLFSGVKLFADDTSVLEKDDNYRQGKSCLIAI